MKLRDVKVGLVLDGHVYAPAPVQPLCKGCDLFARCNGGRDFLCEFIERLHGRNCILKLMEENTQIKEENGTDNNRD